MEKGAVDHLNTLKREEVADDNEDLDEAVIDLDELFSDNRRIVLSTLKKIEAQAYELAREPVLELLEKEQDTRMIIAFLDVLSVIGNSSDLFLVRKYVKHTNDMVRAACIRVVCGISSDVQVVEGMVEPFLKDPGGIPRAQAVKAIGNSSFKKVEPVILESLSSSVVSDRAAMAEAVCSLEVDETIPFIRKFAEDSEQTVRMKVLEVLEKGEHSHKPFILKMMVKDSSPVVAKVAKEALRRYETQRMLSIGGFKSMLPEDLPAARKMKDIEELQAKEELDPIDLSHLKDPDPQLKLLCLRKISQRSYDKGYDGVIDLLGVAENPVILAAVIDCITVIGSHDDLASVQHFISHGSSQVRAAAAATINQLARTDEAAFLLLPSVFDSSPLVRVLSGKALLRLKPEEIVSLIGKMATYRSLPVRMRLVQFIRHFSGDVVLKVLSTFIKAPEPKLRMEVLRSLFEQKDPKAIHLMTFFVKDEVKDISTKARQFLAVKSRDGFVEGQRDLPALSFVIQVVEGIIEQSEKETAAQERAEISSSQKEKDSLEKEQSIGLVQKFSEDITGRKELDMLKLNRTVILRDMGRKVYRLLVKKEISHRAYDKTVFLIKKFKHLEENAPAKSQSQKGFWERIQEAAGIEHESGEAKKLKARLEEQYTELGRIAFRLSYTENEIYQDLHMEYIELEAVENRIAEKIAILGLTPESS